MDGPFRATIAIIGLHMLLNFRLFFLCKSGLVEFIVFKNKNKNLIENVLMHLFP